MSTYEKTLERMRRENRGQTPVFCSDLNQHLCERAQFNPDIPILASPVTGIGINVDRIAQLFLLAQARKRQDAPAFVWDVLQANGELLVKDGQALAGAEANLAELRERHTTFIRQSLPILKTLGVAWPGNIDIDPETLYELSVPIGIAT